MSGRISRHRDENDDGVEGPMNTKFKMLVNKALWIDVVWV